MDTKDLIKAYMTYNSQVQAGSLAGSELQAIRTPWVVIMPIPTWSTWASQNLSESEIADFNAVTNTNNPAAIRFAVEALNAGGRKAVATRLNW